MHRGLLSSRLGSWTAIGAFLAIDVGAGVNVHAFCCGGVHRLRRRLASPWTAWTG